MKKICIAIILFVLVGCSNPFTPAGHEGYVYEEPRIFGKGGFRGVLRGPSNFGVSLWQNKVINMDIRPLTYIEKFDILAKDDLNISLKVEAIIKLESNMVEKAVQEYGGNDWYTKFVREPFRAYVNNAVQKTTSLELKVRRHDIATEIQQELQEYVKASPFKIVKIVLGSIQYPAVLAKAVESKLAAQQLLAEKETQKEITIKEASIRIEEAKGIAEAQKIINVTLTDKYLQHEAINAQLKMANSPNHTTVYIPSGMNGIPMVKTLD
jgi:hypothetical protein